MKHAHYALAITLIASIIATGCFAVHLTHVSASVTVTFGEQAKVIPAIDVAQLEVLPLKRKWK